MEIFLSVLLINRLVELFRNLETSYGIYLEKKLLQSDQQGVSKIDFG